MHYELWEMLSRNMLADFDTEEAAMSEIRELLAINPPEMADELVLLWRDGDQGGAVAEGADLAVRARAIGHHRGTLSV